MLHQSASDILEDLTKLKSVKDPNQFLQHCKTNDNFLFAALTEGKHLQAALGEVDPEVAQSFSIYIQARYADEDMLLNSILDSNDPPLIAAFMVSLLKDGIETLDKINAFTFQRLLKLAHANHEVAEAIFANPPDSKSSIASYLLDKQMSSASSASGKEEIEENKEDDISVKLLELSIIYKDLGAKLMKLLHYDAQTDMLGPFKKDYFDRVIFSEVEPAAQKDDGAALHTMARYFRELFRGLKSYLDDNSDDLSKKERTEMEEVLVIAIQNYLNYLALADQAGNKEARKELDSNVESIRAFAYTTIKSINIKREVSFSDFNLLFNLLMRIKENSPHSSLLRPQMFATHDNETYKEGLRLLTQLMLEALPLLPGGEKLAKADILRAALPFIDELQKLGSKDSAQLFERLIAELHALEHPEKNLGKMPDVISDQRSKADKHNYYYGGSTNKAFGLTLAQSLDSSPKKSPTKK